MFGKRHKTIAYGQQQNADQRRVEQRFARRELMARGQQPGEQHRASGKKAHASHHQRRPTGDANGDSEIGGTPDDIQRKQRPDERQQLTGRHTSSRRCRDRKETYSKRENYRAGERFS